jgi:hypothetical protein
MEKKRSWLLTQAGIKPSTWSSWEKYGRIPPADRALVVADSLGVSLEFLVSGRQTAFDMRHTNPLVMQICQMLPDLGEKQLRSVLTAANTARLEQARP